MLKLQFRPKKTYKKFAVRYSIVLSIMSILLVAGIGSILAVFINAATFSISIETENGIITNVNIIDDNLASDQKAIQFGNLFDQSRGPVSYSSLDQAKVALGAPTDANYVFWDSSWPKNRDLEEVFATLGSNDILVLPERPEPYIIDSSEGFRAAGVATIMGSNGQQLPVVSKYKGGRTARTWFAMARAQRGILGMGPNARIEMSQSSWVMEPQIQDKDPNVPGSTGRVYVRTDGSLGGELVGSQEKVIEAEYTNPFFGNFRMKGRDLGGIAYNGIAAKGGKLIQLDLSGGWRGFQSVPNGETGAIAINKNSYFISKCILGTRDDNGLRVGSSPIMINSSPGGTIEDTDASEAVAGMLTIWNSSGKHTLKNVNARFNWGPGINLEKVQSNFELEWIGGLVWSDYQGNGGKTPKPTDQGTKGKMHINIHAEAASAKITLRGVDIDNGPTPGSLNVQAYGSNQKQKLSDIKIYDSNNNLLPVKVYGTINP